MTGLETPRSGGVFHFLRPALKNNQPFSNGIYRVLDDGEPGGAVLGGYPFPYTTDLEEIRDWLTQ